jgi:hypothetical protein
LEGENLWIHHPLHNDYNPTTYGNESLALSYLEEPLDFRFVGHSSYQNFPTIGFSAIAHNKVNDDVPTTNT